MAEPQDECYRRVTRDSHSGAKAGGEVFEVLDVMRRHQLLEVAVL